MVNHLVRDVRASAKMDQGKNLTNIAKMVFRWPTIFMSIHKVIFRKFEDDSKQDKKFTDNIIPNKAMKGLNFAFVCLHKFMSWKRFIVRCIFGKVQLRSQRTSARAQSGYDSAATISMFSLTSEFPTKRRGSRYPK